MILVNQWMIFSILQLYINILKLNIIEEKIEETIHN